MTIYISTVDTAKAVRAALKKNFPGTNFSVRSDIYSGGSSIRVRYVDGPPLTAVTEITDQFEGASFDAMIDLKSPVYFTNPETGERTHWGADYIFVQREYTVEFMTKVVTQVCEKHGWPIPSIGKSNYSSLARIKERLEYEQERTIYMTLSEAGE